LRSSSRKLKPLPPDPFRHQDSVIALFSDAANVSISTDGLLSGADSSSTQQITAILTELAQTAAAVTGEFAVTGEAVPAAPPTKKDDRRKCLETVNKSASNLPFYRSHDILGTKHQFYPIYGSNKDSTYISLRLEVPPVTTDERATVKDGAQYGLVAFYPVPAVTTLVCRVGRGNLIPLTPPTGHKSLYGESPC